MRVRLHDSVDDFRTSALVIYRLDPVVSTVELTVLRSTAEPGVLVTAWEDDDRLMGAALQVGRYPLLCSGIPLEAVPSVVDALAQVPLTAVRGRRDIAEAFAAAWTSASGSRATLSTEERLYRLDALALPAAEGSWRLANENDVDLVAAWLDEFHVTEFGEPPDREHAQRIARTAWTLGDEHVLWELNGTPVSMASVRAPVEAMSRIGPVFTPMHLRGNGYGSAVTAAAASWAQAAGAEHVVLFTDLANPVSNRIYQRIGFRPVVDSARFDFTV